MHKRSRLSFDGIAVGFSVDRAVSILKAEGIETAFINHSGDAYALGMLEDSDGWEVGVPNPLNPREIIHSFSLVNRAVSTSGNYEKYVRYGERSFGHILSPFTGTPGSTMLSATVIADTSLEADALSTGLFCLGLNGASHALTACPNARLVAIAEQGGAPALIASRIRHSSPSVFSKEPSSAGQKSQETPCLQPFTIPFVNRKKVPCS